jgi:NAD(P)-dependent dehydrogenase (short-subunit alcohol dehydrogenase family)
MEFTTNDTFLISGGGTGLGALLAQEIALNYQANLVIVDLLPIPEDIDRLASLDEKGLQQLKDGIHTRLKQTQTRVTPVMLNQEFEAVMRAIEIHKNLEKLRKSSRNVVYIPCDVRDVEALGPLLDQARAVTGPITAILHAAGLDRSHLIDQKSMQEFHAVFTVKAQGANALFELCQSDPLRLVVVMASISGRFGNAAQLDYSAANSYLSYWVRMLHQSLPGIHALSLVWSGWKDVGMAWRNEIVRQHSEESGLNLIEVEQGINAFFKEIETPCGDLEVILHRGLDGFLEEGLSDYPLEDFPLIDRLGMAPGADGLVRRAYRLLSTRRDAFIDQHRLGNTPIMPAVGYVELAVEYYAMLVGKRGHYLLRDLSFTNAFKLFRESPRELFIEGILQPGVPSLAVEIKSLFRAPRMEVDQEVVHACMWVSDDPPELAGLNPQEWDYRLDTPASLEAEESVKLLMGDDRSQRIILGPLFNDSVRDAAGKEPVLIYPKGTTYPAYFPLEQLSNPKYPLARFLVNPCLLDSILQACAAHLLVNRQRVYLPWKIGEPAILDTPRVNGFYKVYTQMIHESVDVVGYNVVMLDETKQIRYYGRDVQFRMINL